MKHSPVLTCCTCPVTELHYTQQHVGPQQAVEENWLWHIITEMRTEPALGLVCTVPASKKKTRFVRLWQVRDWYI